MISERLSHECELLELLIGIFCVWLWPRFAS